MKKRLVTAVAAASLAGGLAIGSFAMPPMAAFAADTSSTASASATARTPGQWMAEALSSLVSKGTITQAQSDAVTSALQAAEPKGGGHGPRGHMDLSAAAKVLGLSDSDLRSAMQSKSLADIAKDKGIDAQKVIEALVAAGTTEIDQQVTSGTTTQAQADQRKADLTQRVTDFVSSVHPVHGEGGPGDGPRPANDDGPGLPSGAAPTASTTTAPAA